MLLLVLSLWLGSGLVTLVVVWLATVPNRSTVGSRLAGSQGRDARESDVEPSQIRRTTRSCSRSADMSVQPFCLPCGDVTLGDAGSA